MRVTEDEDGVMALVDVVSCSGEPSNVEFGVIDWLCAFTNNEIGRNGISILTFADRPDSMSMSGMDVLKKIAVKIHTILSENGEELYCLPFEI